MHRSRSAAVHRQVGVHELSRQTSRLLIAAEQTGVEQVQRSYVECGGNEAPSPGGGEAFGEVEADPPVLETTIKVGETHVYEPLSSRNPRHLQDDPHRHAGRLTAMAGEEIFVVGCQLPFRHGLSTQQEARAERVVFVEHELVIAGQIRAAFHIGDHGVELADPRLAHNPSPNSVPMMLS